MFMRYSGDSNLKGIGLEMGGKSPFIVLDDAPITDDLIEHAAMSAFWNGGQNCSANMRQLIAAPLVEEFSARIVERVKAFRLGDPLDPATDIGSMITQDHKKMVMDYIQSGSDEGAQMIAGGDDWDVVGYMSPKDRDLMPLDLAKDCLEEDGFAFTVPVYANRDKRGSK
jgi:aldehyde dehydrogenase (NAD+)/gamma-glutamyl-gamma-aminobutyraldehyde dehydrogenase